MTAKRAIDMVEARDKKTYDPDIDLAFSGDFLNWRDQRISELASLLTNAFEREWKIEELVDDYHFLGNGQTVAEEASKLLKSAFDIEIRPNELSPFALESDSNDRRDLVTIIGVLLPDGRVCTLYESSEKISGGGILYSSVHNAVKEMEENWLDKD